MQPKYQVGDIVRIKTQEELTSLPRGSDDAGAKNKLYPFGNMEVSIRSVRNDNNGRARYYVENGNNEPIPARHFILSECWIDEVVQDQAPMEVDSIELLSML